MQNNWPQLNVTGRNDHQTVLTKFAIDYYKGKKRSWNNDKQTKLVSKAKHKERGSNTKNCANT